MTSINKKIMRNNKKKMEVINRNKINIFRVMIIKIMMKTIKMRKKRMIYNNSNNN